MARQITLDDWMPVFKGGWQTDSEGNRKFWTDEELDQIVNTFDAGNPPPACIGHPEGTKPAVAWPSAVKRVGKILYTKWGRVVDAFRQQFESGEYRNRSLGLRKTQNGWKIDHIAFLGAMPPAVDGLGTFEASADCVVYTFNAFTTSVLADALRSIKNWLIDFQGKESADGILPEYQIEGLRENARIEREQELSDEGTQAATTDRFERDEGNVVSTKDETAEFQRQLQEQKQQLATAQQEAETAKRELKQHRYALRLEPLVAGGKLAREEADRLIAIALALPDTQVKFQRDGAESSFNSADWLIEFASKRGANHKADRSDGDSLSGEQAGDESDPGKPDAAQFSRRRDGTVVMADDAEFDSRCREYAAKHKCSYADAVVAIEGELS